MVQFSKVPETCGSSLSVQIRVIKKNEELWFVTMAKIFSTLVFSMLEPNSHWKGKSQSKFESNDKKISMGCSWICGFLSVLDSSRQNRWLGSSRCAQIDFHFSWDSEEFRDKHWEGEAMINLCISAGASALSRGGARRLDWNIFDDGEKEFLQS